MPGNLQGPLIVVDDEDTHSRRVRRFRHAGSLPKDLLTGSPGPVPDYRNRMSINMIRTTAQKVDCFG
jgi:hypothetical protein